MCIHVRAAEDGAAAQRQPARRRGRSAWARLLAAAVRRRRQPLPGTPPPPTLPPKSAEQLQQEVLCCFIIRQACRDPMRVERLVGVNRRSNCHAEVVTCNLGRSCNSVQSSWRGIVQTAAGEC